MGYSFLFLFFYLLNFPGLHSYVNFFIDDYLSFPTFKFHLVLVFPTYLTQQKHLCKSIHTYTRTSVYLYVYMLEVISAMHFPIHITNFYTSH